MAFKVDGDRPPANQSEGRHWALDVPLSGWVALIFYGLAIMFGLMFFSGESLPLVAGAALSCLATGTVLGALSRIIRILRDIRDR